MNLKMEVEKMEKVSMEEIGLMILEANTVDIRNVPKKVTNREVEKLPREKQPFLYASGNWGPGYVMIKGLVGRKIIMKFLAKQLAIEVFKRTSQVDFVAGNVSGGVIPAWLLSEELESLLGKTVPFVYIREARKKGGQKELVTGIANNPEIPAGAKGLVVEELVNFAQTTCNGANALRDAGYSVTHAATILFYDNPEAIKLLEEHRVGMIYLLTLPNLLMIAEKRKTHLRELIDDYREFLEDPLDWQAKRGLEPRKEGGT